MLANRCVIGLAADVMTPQGRVWKCIGTFYFRVRCTVKTNSFRLWSHLKSENIKWRDINALDVYLTRIYFLKHALHCFELDTKTSTQSNPLEVWKGNSFAQNTKHTFIYLHIYKQYLHRTNDSLMLLLT